MPKTRETRVRDGVLAAAVVASGENVTEERHYGRDLLAYSPERDGLPGVVVARTPGRGPTSVPKLSWQEWVFPVTALLVTAATGGVSEPDDWRNAWVEAVLDACGGPSPFKVEDDEDSVTEVHYVDPDSLANLDLAVFEQAGLRVASCSVLVTVRVPY